MPILWRYLLGGYAKIFTLCVCSFVSILVVSRFKEMARFISLSDDPSQGFIFILYQIPFILPIAIPISALITSLLLFQKMSHSFELTALRSSGVSLSSILTPILALSAVLSCINLAFCAEISPFCKRESKALFYRETSTNPLLLVQRQPAVPIKNAYMRLKVKEGGKLAKDFIFVGYNESNERLSLLSARKLKISGKELLGYGVTILSHLASDQEQEFDPLILENQSSMMMQTPILSAALTKKRPRLDPSLLGMRLLKCTQTKVGLIEMLRRFFLSLSVFSLTLLGCAFGMQQGRNLSRKSILIATVLTAALLVSYVLGKALKSHPMAAILTLTLPHPLIWALSTWKFWKEGKA